MYTPNKGHLNFVVDIFQKIEESEVGNHGLYDWNLVFNQELGTFNYNGVYRNDIVTRIKKYMTRMNE